MDRKKLDPILKKHGLVLVENRYLKGIDYKDGTVSWDAAIDSIILNNTLPEVVFAEIGKVLNPPKVVTKKKKAE